LNFGHGCVKPQTGRTVEIAVFLNPPPGVNLVVTPAMNRAKV
jgi:hypothetical protein